MTNETPYTPRYQFTVPTLKKEQLIHSSRMCVRTFIKNTGLGEPYTIVIESVTSYGATQVQHVVHLGTLNASQRFRHALPPCPINPSFIFLDQEEGDELNDDQMQDVTNTIKKRHLDLLAHNRDELEDSIHRLVMRLEAHELRDVGQPLVDLVNRLEDTLKELEHSRKLTGAVLYEPSVYYTAYADARRDVLLALQGNPRHDPNQAVDKARLEALENIALALCSGRMNQVRGTYGSHVSKHHSNVEWLRTLVNDAKRLVENQ